MQSNKLKPSPQPWGAVTDDMARLLRQKTGAERLAMAHRMWRFGFQLIRRSVKNQHPNWTREQVESEVSRRMSHGAV